MFATPSWSLLVSSVLCYSLLVLVGHFGYLSILVDLCRSLLNFVIPWSCLDVFIFATPFRSFLFDSNLFIPCLIFVTLCQSLSVSSDLCHFLSVSSASLNLCHFLSIFVGLRRSLPTTVTPCERQRLPLPPPPPYRH